MGSNESKEKKGKRKSKDQNDAGESSTSTTTTVSRNGNTIQQKTTTISYQRQVSQTVIRKEQQNTQFGRLSSALPDATGFSSSPLRMSTRSAITPQELNSSISTFSSPGQRSFRVRSNTQPGQLTTTGTTPQTNDIAIRVKKALILQKPIGHVPTYNTTGKLRGVSLIINNIEFTPHRREGAEVDGTNMFNLLQGLKLDPKMKNNMSKQQMNSCLRDFSKNSKLSKADLCVIVIMSHGTGSMDVQTEVMGVDNQGLKIYDIVSHFSETNCKALKGKPKIFIFQCCRGDQKLDQHDSSPSQPPNCANMLLAYATMPGFVAWRDIERGSYYIREICNVFMNYAHNTHVEDMLKAVSENVRRQKTQLTSYENWAFKNCYLNPV